MRRNTPKRAAKNRIDDKLRKQLKIDVGACELCRKQRMPNDLAAHEILSGTWGRRLAQNQPYAILIVCRWPNWRTGERCHATVQDWPEAKQLALLMLVSTRYDLVAFNNLVNPNAPNRIEQHEVDPYAEELLAVNSMLRSEQT